jgi:hypothetical protein
MTPCNSSGDAMNEQMEEFNLGDKRSHIEHKINHHRLYRLTLHSDAIGKMTPYVYLFQDESGSAL